MNPRLWYMNADFELELQTAPGSRYRRTEASVRLNLRLAAHLLWLARPGDALLFETSWPESLTSEAASRGVELITSHAPGDQSQRLFTPWGWAASAVTAGERAGAIVQPPSLETVRRVNSKLWSHALEVEFGVALPGAATAATLGALREAVARVCPQPNDKWVIKSPYGFAARERVLGRGPALAGPQETWCRRRIDKGETLILQPWLDKVREYGMTLTVGAGGEIDVHGISDLLTNGAGTSTGYLFGRPPVPRRMKELKQMALLVGRRLRAEGYTGPAGIDAIEHAGGLHPLLEVNARYTMGFVALAVERSLKLTEPTIWKPTDVFQKMDGHREIIAPQRESLL